MRIPACVMADLRAQFTSAEAIVWITAWDCVPDSVNPKVLMPNHTGSPWIGKPQNTNCDDILAVPINSKRVTFSLSELMRS